jgi:hypothetical protein
MPEQLSAAKGSSTIVQGTRRHLLAKYMHVTGDKSSTPNCSLKGTSFHVQMHDYKNVIVSIKDTLLS